MHDPEDLPRFRPRFGKRTKSSEPGPKSFRATVNELLARRRAGAPARSKAGRPLGPDRNWEALRPGARRVIIKTNVVRLGRDWRYTQRSISRHLSYITRDGVEKDGTPGVLYGPEGPACREDFEGRRDGEKHQFRFQISPEEGDRLDLTDFVRTLMREVERDIGRRLEWVATNHYNTAHPHAHVVVRGVDLDGHELRLTREYISRGMRWRAQELATDTLGLRNEFEIRRTLQREVTQDRFTSLDRELDKLAVDGVVRPRSPARRRSLIEPSTLFARLAHLKTVNLARELASNEWELAEGWQTFLRDRGERGDIIKRIHRTVGGDSSRYHWVRSGQPVLDPHTGDIQERALAGRVADKGLDDENKETFYAVLETPEGRAYHVPLEPRLVDSMRVGDLVTLRSERVRAVRPIDREFVEAAGRSGGIYAIAADAEGAARAAKRLSELEREGLVTRQRPGAWKVPANLLEQLEVQEQSRAPRYRVHIEPLPLSLEEQVRRRAPVWLDTLETRGLSPRGFGAELMHLLERRHAFLRELGVDPADRSRVEKLAEFARQTVGKDIARETRMTWLEAPPKGFHGVVRPGSPADPFLAVGDGKRFVLVPATPDARAFHGKVVEVASDADGRLRLVREDPARTSERHERARLATGETLARQTHRTFLPSIPPGFRGRIQSPQPGTPFVEVSDGVRFVLIPTTPDAQALAGKTVELTRDDRGRFLGLQPVDRDLDRTR